MHAKVLTRHVSTHGKYKTEQAEAIRNGKRITSTETGRNVINWTGEQDKKFIEAMMLPPRVRYSDRPTLLNSTHISKHILGIF